MPRRNILTDRQRAVIFDLPTDQAALLRHYTLADDDLEIIRARRARGTLFSVTPIPQSFWLRPAALHVTISGKIAGAG